MPKTKEQSNLGDLQGTELGLFALKQEQEEEETEEKKEDERRKAEWLEALKEHSEDVRSTYPEGKTKSGNVYHMPRPSRVSREEQTGQKRRRAS